MNNRYWMVGHRVELPEMLMGRERRARKQEQIHRQYPGTMVCFTLNIAGPIKVFPLSQIIFQKTVGEIESCLKAASFPVTYQEVDPCSYGWEAYFCVDGDAMEVKRALLALEENRPAGRLFDIDVFRGDGTKVSREDFGLPPRSCLICGEPTIACARSRAHTVPQLQAKTVDIFLEDLKQKDGSLWMDAGRMTSWYIGILCRHAMLLEVYTTPKPGLVDLANTGSHTDMDVELFEKSAQALEDYFATCTGVGRGCGRGGMEPEEVLKLIRPYGVKAETTMLEATGGVNTHKGMIFSLGILACAVGYLSAADNVADKMAFSSLANAPTGSSLNPSAILSLAGRIASPAWEKDFENLQEKNAENMTAGEKQFTSYGIGGIRAEAAAGFPSVRDIAYPVLKKYLNLGCDWQMAGAMALLSLTAQVVDTNMIKRVGVEKAEELRKKAGTLFEKAEKMFAEEKVSCPENGSASLCEDDLSSVSVEKMEAIMDDIRELDQEFIACHASPGGCADLLALSYFLECVSALG